MRISDWSSDVCSSDLSAYPISPGSREADITATSTCSGSPARSEPARGSSDFRKYARRADCASERLGPKSAQDQETTAGTLQAMTGLSPALCAATITIGVVIALLATGLLLVRSEEHTSELQSLMRIAYDV